MKPIKDIKIVQGDLTEIEKQVLYYSKIGYILLGAVQITQLNNSFQEMMGYATMVKYDEKEVLL